MAMPSGNVGGGGDIHHRQWFLDERDEFISWLRGEFAASNAIIDSLCHHFRSIGEPGEYDLVIGCIQQRRCNWNSVLHMQQYFSVAEVIYALQQVAWRRQQMYFEQGKVGSKESRRFGVGTRQGQRGDSVKEVHNSSVKGQQVSDNCEEVKSEKAAVKLNDKELAAVEEKKENNSHTVHNHNEKQIRTPIAKSFIGTEIFEGKTVNVVDGLKLYEKLIDDTEVSKLVSLASDLRAAGKRGQFQGQTYVVLTRSMKGHGREMIQLGLPIADAPPKDEIATGTTKDQRIESIPALLQDLVERMVDMQIIIVWLDSCIIDFYNKGDHSQPHMRPTWFGRLISILFLIECDVTFGRAIGVNHPGDYTGSLKISRAPRSLLMMQGKLGVPNM